MRTLEQFRDYLVGGTFIPPKNQVGLKGGPQQSQECLRIKRYYQSEFAAETNILILFFCRVRQVLRHLRHLRQSCLITTWLSKRYNRQNAEFDIYKSLLTNFIIKFAWYTTYQASNSCGRFKKKLMLCKGRLKKKNIGIFH